MTASVVINQKTPLAPLTTYIPPQQQLEELIEPYVAPIAARLKKERLYRDLERLIALYAADPDPRLTHWFTALNHLRILPPLVPRLPRYMYQILMGKCPVFESEKKPNRSSYKVIDTSVLYLLPEQRRSFEVTVERIGKRAEKYGIEEPTSYKIDRFYEKAKQEHGQVERVIPMEWHLMTIWTVPGSHTVPHGHHAQMLKALNARAFVKYQLLSLHTAPLVLFFHKVATGQRLYQDCNLQKTGRPSFSYVIERTKQHGPLAMGSFSKKGLLIERAPKDEDNDNTGVGFSVKRTWS